ncbi:MAG: sugar phosphate isomerase/epimerase [Candidatus Omnitrophica bacterium]|nr:sugar phosphate isomerase/epimerase [Candidatus Omnitrophota bacterium]
MDADFQKYFRPGIVHFMAFPDATDKKSFIETIKKIACDDYFEAIEITFIEDADTRNQVRNLIEGGRVEVHFGAQPVLLGGNLNLNDEDPAVRKKSVQVIKKCIDQACEMDAKGLSFLGGRYEHGKKEYAFNFLVDSTNKICEYAKKKGLMIELEIFDYDIDKKSLVGPAWQQILQEP